MVNTDNPTQSSSPSTPWMGETLLPLPPRQSIIAGTGGVQAVQGVNSPAEGGNPPPATTFAMGDSAIDQRSTQQVQDVQIQVRANNPQPPTNAPHRGTTAAVVHPPQGPNPPPPTLQGAGSRISLWTRIFACMYLMYIFIVRVTPTVRVGLSWARSHSHMIQPLLTAVCIVLLFMQLMGQAQLFQRIARALHRIFPTRRHPATNGDHGRDRGALAAVQGTPSMNNLPVTPQPAPQPTTSTDPGLQAILDALLEIRDQQLQVKEEIAVMQSSPPQVPPPPPMKPVPIGHVTPIPPRNLHQDFQSSYPSRAEPSPMVSKAAHQLQNGRWELGSDYHSAMVKSAPTMVTKLPKSANYETLKAWTSAVEDWVFSHTQVFPEDLGPTAVRSIARMTLSAELYSILENSGALGNRSGKGEPASWNRMMDHLREKLGCSSANLKLGLAMLRQGNLSMVEFAQEFERHARDAEVSDEDAKVLLVGNLNQQTLVRLDTFVTTSYPGQVSGKETMIERLRRISYPAMLGFLKQGSLSDLAQQGAGGTKLPGTHGGTHNNVDTASAGHDSAFAAAGIMTASTDELPAKPPHMPKKDKKPKLPKQPKQPQKGYEPEPVPNQEELLKVYQVALATADQLFTKEMCMDPLPMLASVIAVLSASEENEAMPDSAKEKVTSAIRFLAERLATLQAVVDPSTPRVNAANLLPTGTQKRGPARTMLFDIARGLARRVPLTKLVALDGDVRPYLASLMVSAIHRAGDELVVPDGTKIRKISTDAFDNMLKEEAGRTYDNYGMIAQDLFGGQKLSAAEEDRLQKKRLEGVMNKVVEAMENITGNRYNPDDDMKFDIGAVLEGTNGERISAMVVGVAKKIEDNILKTVTAAATTPDQLPGKQTTPGSATIKQVRRASGKLLQAKSVAQTPSPLQQPHIQVAISGASDQPSKWEQGKPSVNTTKGHMMIDTGAAVTLVTRVWAQTHGLKITQGKKVTIRGAAGGNIEVIGTIAFTIQVSPTLEMDLADVIVSEGDFYQALIGGDLLRGKPGVLGPATIIMPGFNQNGSIQWNQEKAGCIAVAEFLTPKISANKGDALPPLPPPADDKVQTTLEAEGVKMDQSQRKKLAGLAAERDAQMGKDTSTEEWRDLFDRARCLFRECALPINVSRLLSRIFSVRSIRQANCETAIAKVLSASQKKGYEAGLQVLEGLGISAPLPPRRS